MYKGRTNVVIRQDLNEVFKNENCNYVNSGFAITFRNKELGKNMEKCTIILQYSNNGVAYYVDTNKTLK